jgi:2-iminobutanoate/2-iminopropanoate deaminase
VETKREEKPMTIRRVTSPVAPEPPPERWSNCLVVDGIAYVSGMTARGDDAKALASMDEYAQARVIFTKIKGLIEAAGGTMSDIVKITVFVTDIKNNVKVWQARREFFSGNFPASTLVEVSALASPEIRVEIEAVAHIGKGQR